MLYVPPCNFAAWTHTPLFHYELECVGQRSRSRLFGPCDIEETLQHLDGIAVAIVGALISSGSDLAHLPVAATLSERREHRRLGAKRTAVEASNSHPTL